MYYPTLFELVDLMKLPRPTRVFQAGANVGQEIDIFLKQGIDVAVLVEPIESCFHVLEERINKDCPAYFAVNALLSNVSGERLELNIASNQGGSSSVLEPSGHKRLFPSITFDEVQVLYSTTIDEVMNKLLTSHGVDPRSFDTLYMDVQGFEYKVILGAQRSIMNFKYIYFEHFRPVFYEGSIPLIEYIALLGNFGFVLNNLNYNRAHHTELFFIRKDLVGL